MGASSKPLRIVLVEDDPADVYLLEKALQQLQVNYDLIRYEDGEKALKAFADDQLQLPDLILLDLNLPRREGFEVLRSVRSKPRLTGVPVGVLTASDAAKDRHRVALMGGERYIHKPPTLEEFLDQVGSAIRELLDPPAKA